MRMGMRKGFDGDVISKEMCMGICVGKGMDICIEMGNDMDM